MRDPHAFTLFPPPTRLAEPEFEPLARAAYGRALDALLRDGVGFLVGGALALHAHTGIWRDTKDLDVFVRPRDAGRALAALERAGFDSVVVYESWLGKGWLGEVFVDVLWRNANGLFPPTDEWFSHAESRTLLGRLVPVLAPEELIVSKIMVGGRHRFDGADVLHVLHAAHDRLDWRRLEKLAGEHAGLLLAYLHLYRWGYPAFAQRVPADAMSRLDVAARSAPSTWGPFRALLLDLQSFRVDVEGWGLPDPHAAVLDHIFGPGAESKQ